MTLHPLDVKWLCMARSCLPGKLPSRFWEPDPFARALHHGFSLVELLTVIALLIVLATASAPVLSSMSKSGTMNKAVLNISSTLEQAQSYAMANNTYVWVGFYHDTTSNNLSVAAVAGTTGSVTDFASPANLRSVIKPQNYENLRLQTDAELAENQLPGMSAGVNVTRSSLGSFTQNLKNYDSVIQFGPMGGSRIDAASIPHWIQLGLQSVSGSHVDKSTVATMQLGGLTGQVRIFRP